MAHGGARPRSGPAPDPNALRRDRPSDHAGWVTLPAETTDPAPDWPLTVPPTDPEVTHWEAAWRTPQATEWHKLSNTVEVALYVRVLALAEIPGAPVGLIKEARMAQENLGLSHTGLLKYRWRINGADTPTPAATATDKSPAARPARGRPSTSRDRFRVVPSPEGD